MADEREPIRLNLGSGKSELPGYVNLDIKDGPQGAAYPLTQYADNSVDEVRASHLLEHYSHTMSLAVLAEWIRVLKPGATLKVAVPNFEHICREYLKGLDRPDEPAQDMPVAAYVMGGHVDEHDYHKALFDEGGLWQALEMLGLTEIRRWDSDAEDCSALPVSLNLQGVKGEGRSGTDALAAMMEPVEVEPKGRPFDWLGAYARNVYSQTGEDGILEGIFAHIGTRNRWCFEVGAGDGTLCSNTRHLIEQGWHGVLVECDADKCDRLEDLHRGRSTSEVSIWRVEVSTEPSQSIDTLLSMAQAPTDLDLCIIDVDGQEWHLWNSLIHYRPRVVICEYNPKAPAGFVPPRGGEGQAGLMAIKELATSKGYEPVVITPYNVIAVKRSELKPLIGAEGAGQAIGEAQAEPVGWHSHEPRTTDCTHAAITEPEAPAPEVPPPPTNHGPDPVVTRPPDVLVAPAKLKTDMCAVMTVPRLMFTGTTICLTRAVGPLGLRTMFSEGVFWGQCLSRVMREEMAKGFRYLLAIDYDSVFSTSDIIELYETMERHPEIGALIPVQCKRASGAMLFHLGDEEGNVRRAVSFAEFKEEVVPIRAGHFGLTLLRSEAVAKVPHPWFEAIPDPITHEWDDGRCDEDVKFWLKFRDAGQIAALAPRVVIGHLEQVVTWPNRALKPFYQHEREYAKAGKPEGVWR